MNEFRCAPTISCALSLLPLSISSYAAILYEISGSFFLPLSSLFLSRGRLVRDVRRKIRSRSLVESHERKKRNLSHTWTGNASARHCCRGLSRRSEEGLKRGKRERGKRASTGTARYDRLEISVPLSPFPIPFLLPRISAPKLSPDLGDLAIAVETEGREGIKWK